MSAKNKIKELRDKINFLDDRIIKLLEERFLISKEIGKIKLNSESSILDTNLYLIHIYDPTRQAELS